MDDFRKELIKKLKSDEIKEDKDILPIMLSNAFEDRDVTADIAKLTKSFPNIKTMLEASYEELTTCIHVSEEVALYISALGRIVSGGNYGTKIASSDEAIAYARGRIKAESNEFFEMYLIGEDDALLDVKTYTSGRECLVQIDSKKVLSEMTYGKVKGVYLVHNHIVGGLTPSGEDDYATRRLLAVCKKCGIILLDHCIIGEEGAYSYRRNGKIKK